MAACPIPFLQIRGGETRCALVTVSCTPPKKLPELVRGILMRCVGVCVAAAVVAGLAIGGPRPSIAEIDRMVVQDSDDEDEDAENEERTETKSSASQAESPGRIDPAAANLDPDLVPGHVLFFSGADIWRNGLFSHTGLFWAY